MSEAEDRQAKALEQIAHQSKELVRVMATMNENFVMAFKYLKEVIERDEANFNSPEDLNQMTLDEIRAAERAEETARQDRERRSRYEETLRSSPIDIEHNKFEHTSEFNNPEHRPIKFQPPGEGSE